MKFTSCNLSGRLFVLRERSMIQFSLLPNQTLGIFVIANYKKKNHQPNNQFFFSFINIDFFLDQVRPRMSY